MGLLMLARRNRMILLILLVTAAIHLWRIDSLITVGGDAGYDLLKIKEILDGDLTLLGSPIGRFDDSVLYLGPLYYYLQALFLVLFKLDPIGLAPLIIIGRLATTFFVYLAAKQLFNWPTAAIAAVLSGISPYFFDKLGPPSPPYLIPTIVALIVLLLVKKTKTLTTFVFLGLASGLMVHLHYLGLSVLLALIFFIFYGYKGEKLKSLFFIILGFFISISPLVLFELRNNFFISRQLFSQLAAGAVSSQDFSPVNKISTSVNFLAGDIFGFALPFFAALIIFIMSVIVALKVSKEKPAIYFLISILVINLTAAALYKQQVQPHYLAAVYVPLFIFVAAMIFSLSKFAKPIPIILTLILILALVLEFDLSRTSGYTMPEDLTLRQIRKISRIIADDTKGEFNITSTLDGDSRALPYRFLVSVYGKEPQDYQTYDRGDFLYIITRDPAMSVRVSTLFEIASFQPSYVENTWYINGDIRLIKLSKQKPKEQEPPKFITITNPVRPRYLWNDQSLSVIESQIAAINNRNLKSTWLLSYENILDSEIVEFFKRQRGHEIGAYLEVSEKWATDSHVAYKISEGDYYRPDKVFLSGYSPQDREKLIKTYFKKFKQVFGYTPKSVGAWYIDANSHNLLSKLGVTSALTVADQFDTDAASIWGKYWSMPFYPSKLNSLEPAKSQSDKLPIVNIQWAQRDLVAGYGREIKDSRQSFQANDYVNNGYDTTYFIALLESYLANAQSNDFMQITIGLEAGQEAQRFASEFERQMEIISQKQKSGELNVTSMEEFANWYHQKFPGLSPPHLLAKGESFWYMTPKFRVAIFKESAAASVVDLRYYGQSIFKDTYYGDSQAYLKRNVPHLVDNVSSGNKISLGTIDTLEKELHFDRLSIKTDNRLVEINQYLITGQIENYDKNDHQTRMILTKIRQQAMNLLSVFRYSVIDGKRIFGMSFNGTTIVGFRDFTPGIYKYDFQIAARFLSPAMIIEKWRP